MHSIYDIYIVKLVIQIVSSISFLFFLLIHILILVILYDQPQIGKNTGRAARRLITISPGDGRYHGDWTCDYLLSLQDLQLQDLIEADDERHKDAPVFINLNIQKVVPNILF